MNPEIKDRWVKALKSGKYRQCVGGLRNSQNEFCCLGVLTDLYLIETRQKWGCDGMNGSYLSADVVKWAELDAWNPKIGYEYAAVLNDNKVSFEEIAKRISEQSEL